MQQTSLGFFGVSLTSEVTERSLGEPRRAQNLLSVPFPLPKTRQTSSSPVQESLATRGY